MSQSKTRGELPPVIVKLILPFAKLQEEESIIGLKTIGSKAVIVIHVSIEQLLSSIILTQ